MGIGCTDSDQIEGGKIIFFPNDEVSRIGAIGTNMKKGLFHRI